MTSARDFLDLVLDAGSFTSWDRPIPVADHADEYRDQLRRAATRAGTDESVLTGRGTVRGRPVAVLVSEFGFLGGSIGRGSAARLVEAIARATDEGLPLLAATASGGTRMQEGTAAFVTMVDISRAVLRHRRAGLPYITYLRHPTTGGVLASWASLGHVTVAEPRALVGFLGPKVYATLTGEQFPADVQVSENLVRHGIIDAVVPPDELADLLDATLSVLQDGPSDPGPVRPGAAPSWSRTTWESIEQTRDERRPGVRDLLELGADGTVLLKGAGDGREPAVLTALTRLSGEPCVVIGQDRAAQGAGRAVGPAALREARQAMALASELRVPVVTVIDTPGAELSPAAENGALAGEIARCIASMTSLDVSVVSVLMGQGGGGAALALLPADHVIACESAWLLPLPPEGASAIVHGDALHAAEMADLQGGGARALHAAGIVHTVVAEPESMTTVALCRELAAACGRSISRLRAPGGDDASETLEGTR